MRYTILLAVLLAGAVQAQTLSQVASDNFQQANGPLSANWSVQNGTWAISSNQATSSTQGNNVARWVGTGSFTNNQYAIATVGSSFNAYNYVGVALEANGTQWYDFAVKPTTGLWYLRKNGASLATGTTATFGAGAVVELDLNGGVLTAYITTTSKAQIVTYTDASPLSGGVPGLFSYYAESYSNWSAGNISSTAPLTITTTSLPIAIAGTSYSYTLQASGGTSPYTWSLASGSLPSGMSLSSAGVLSGTPATGGSWTFTVAVADSAGGVQQAQLTFGAENSYAASLGLGVLHTVDLAWGAGTAAAPATVSGYNVYRGSASGGPYTKLNSALIAPLSYFDFGVSSGSTLYYVVTTVDSTGLESAYSNQVAAAVPNP